jgi:hypothetical protein
METSKIFSKNYFEDSELNKLFTHWLGNFPESFNPQDIKRFIRFSIRALELNKYEFHIIANALRENNAHAREDESIIDSYGSYFHTIDLLYEELKLQRKIK